LSSRRERALLDRALRDAGAAGEALDVPCAAGRMVPVILGRARRVVAADVSVAMVEVAREALAAPIAGGRVEAVRADAEALPLGDRPFDVAVCWRRLHHLTERAARVRVLSELRRVSRGAVVVTFSDAGTIRARLQRLRGRSRRTVALAREALSAEAADAG